MVDLVITLRELSAALRALAQTEKQKQILRYPLHLSRFQNGMEFLAHSGSLQDADGTLLLWPIADAAAPVPAAWTESLQKEGQRPLVGLGVGIGSEQGKVAGRVHFGAGQSRAAGSLDRMRIVGPQMPTLPLSDDGRVPSFRPLWVSADGLYSRLIGTVGLRTFARLQHARIAVIGAGGNGSLMAEQLARWMGREGRLGLIDADRIEFCNLPAWGACGGADAEALLGRQKAEALADHLRTLPDAPEIEPIVASVLDWSALSVLKRYDLFVCCVDNPTARCAATFLATLFLRPLLDIATGVFLGTTGGAEHSAKIAQEETIREANWDLFHRGRLPYSLIEAGPRTMGADVRLVLPGSGEHSGNCLLCLGGVGDLATVRKELNAPQHRQALSSAGAHFWQFRAGSLSILNSDAVNQGLRMLIAFLEGSTTASEHWQMNESLRSPPTWHQVSTEVKPCRLCDHAGYGDSALDWMRTFLHDT